LTEQHEKSRITKYGGYEKGTLGSIGKNGFGVRSGEDEAVDVGFGFVVGEPEVLDFVGGFVLD